MIMVIKTVIMVSLIMGLMGCICAIKIANKGEINLGYIIGSILGIVAWPFILVGMAMYKDIKGGRA